MGDDAWPHRGSQRPMRPERLRDLAAGVGILLGVTTARWVLVGSWTSLVPWTIAGLTVGLAARDTAGATRAGAFYGAGLVAAFVIGGRHGDFTRQWLAFVLFTLVLAAIGAGCGAMLGFLGRCGGSRLTATHGNAPGNRH